MPKPSIVMVGMQHPHMFVRIEYFHENTNLLGFFDADDSTAEALLQRYPYLKRFHSVKELVTSTTPDCCFIHALDPDVPTLALQVMEHCPTLKGLFLEKPGASTPQKVFEFIPELGKYPNLVVEYGWEMHYSELMDFSRDLLQKKVLGDVTTAHFHGGTPSGGAIEKWQSLDGSLGGFVYTDLSHTFEQVVDLFGLPERVVASIRKLPPGKEEFGCVAYIPELFGQEKASEHKTKVGSVRYEDIGSVIMEYEDKNVVLDFTAWELKHWCADWSVDLYGTNGILHGFLNPPALSLFLIESRAGYKMGESKMPTMLPQGENNWRFYFERQVVEFLQRCDGKHNSGHEICGVTLELQLMKLLEAIFKSAETRTFVEVEV